MKTFTLIILLICLAFLFIPGAREAAYNSLAAINEAIFGTMHERSTISGEARVKDLEEKSSLDEYAPEPAPNPLRSVSEELRQRRQE